MPLGYGAKTAPNLAYSEKMFHSNRNPGKLRSAVTEPHQKYWLVWDEIAARQAPTVLSAYTFSMISMKRRAWGDMKRPLRSTRP